MKNKVLLLLFTLFAFNLVYCSSKDKQEDDKKTISIFHYNVGAFSKTDNTSIQYIASMIKETDAELLSVNEIDSCNTRHTNNQLSDLGKALGGWNSSFAKAMDYQEGGYGVGTLASPKHHVVATYTLNLEKGDGSEPRAASVMEFNDMVMVSTHLDHKSDAAQLNQAKQLSSWLMQKYSGSGKIVILAGDFNAVPSSSTMQYMFKTWKLLSPLNATYSAQKPSKCIDYILVLGNGKEVKVLKSEIMTKFKTGDVTIASDHLPLYVQMEIE